MHTYSIFVLQSRNNSNLIFGLFILGTVISEDIIKSVFKRTSFFHIVMMNSKKGKKGTIQIQLSYG